MLTGVKESADETLTLIGKLRILITEVKWNIRSRHKRMYSQDLVNHIFAQPYTKVNHAQKALSVSRPTATRYLDALANDGILSKHKHGRENYYVNDKMIKLLWEHPRDGAAGGRGD